MYSLRSLAFSVKGYLNFTKNGYVKAAKSFDPHALDVDMSDRNVVVTGANTGIGYAVAEALASRKASVHMVCRNEARGTAAMEKIRGKVPDATLTLHVCDVSSLASVKEFAGGWKEAGLPLHVLVNNAGCMVHDQSVKSADGYDINFATNTLGTFALTRLMQPVLDETAQNASEPVRVITVSSGGMLTEPLVVDDLEGSTLSPYNAIRQYARDKRRQVALMELFASRSASAVEEAAPADVDSGDKAHNSSGGSKRGSVQYFSMHPGWSETEGVANALPSLSSGLSGNLRDWDMAADTIVWLAVVKEGGEKGVTLHPGEFYFDREPTRKVTALDFGCCRYSMQEVERLSEKLSSMAEL